MDFSAGQYGIWVFCPLPLVTGRCYGMHEEQGRGYDDGRQWTRKWREISRLYVGAYNSVDIQYNKLCFSPMIDEIHIYAHTYLQVNSYIIHRVINDQSDQSFDAKLGACVVCATSYT